MKIKETIIMGLFCLLTIPTIKAQGKISETNYEGHHKECSKKHSIENFKQKIKTQKIAFITQELKLTIEEAQKFWPIFNMYEDEMMSVREKIRPKDTTSEGFPKRPDFLKMSDEEAQDMINKHLRTERDILEIQEKYAKELKTAIPVQKVMMFFMVEKKFMTQMIGKNWKDHKGDRKAKAHTRRNK
ncbi:MAG: hypothetical protein PHE13_06755 [Bacteroidales bacterium]|nr:hypothetical protein [Bacteroidales bacterium]